MAKNRTPEEQRARNHAAAKIHEIRRQRDDYNKNIINKYNKIKSGNDAWWDKDCAYKLSDIADAQIADNNAFCNKWSKEYLERGKKGQTGYPSGLLSKLGDYIDMKESGKRATLNRPDFGMCNSGEHTTIPFHKSLDTRYDADDYFEYNHKDRFHGIVPKTVDRHFSTPDVVRKKKAEFWKKNGYRYGNQVINDLTDDDIDYVQNLRDKLAEELRNKRKKFRNAVEDIEDPKLVDGIYNIEKSRVNGFDKIGNFKIVRDLGQKVNKRDLENLGESLEKFSSKLNDKTNTIKRENKLTEEYFEELNKELDKKRQNIETEYVEDKISDFLKNNKKLLVGAGIIGAAVGYGGYKLYKHYKDKKKESEDDNTER